MKIVNLKNNIICLNDYINLRNKYSHCLLTDKVTHDSTKEWLKFKDVNVFLALQEKEMVGALILYHHRNNEIAIFTKYQSKGIGTKLLDYIIRKAELEKYKLLWAWVKQNNISSYRLFKKFGFIRTNDSVKEFNNIKVNGYILEKKLGG